VHCGVAIPHFHPLHLFIISQSTNAQFWSRTNGRGPLRWEQSHKHAIAIHIAEPYRAALKNLDTFSHVIVFWSAVKINNIGAFNQTPVPDLKAYSPVVDRVKNATVSDYLAGFPDEGLGLMEHEQ
jgi:tRNA (Thr-GGU) A37 N-methylase